LAEIRTRSTPAGIWWPTAWAGEFALHFPQLNFSEINFPHNSPVRMFAIPLVIVALFALDRAYMDGQNAAQVMSVARWAGAHVTNWTDDLLRPLNR
jgi:hypothetical protein